MSEKFKRFFFVMLYSTGCGLMLSIFPFVRSGVNLLFSLMALVVGLMFFKRFSGIGARIAFVGLSLLFFILFTVVITIILYMREHPQSAADAALAVPLVL